MKDAAGEANLTVLAIVLIGVVAAVATPIINSTMQATAKQSCCSNYGGIWESGQCKTVSSTGAKTVVAVQYYWDASNKKCN